MDMYTKHNSLTAWSLLESGILSGQCNNDISEGSRMTNTYLKTLVSYFDDQEDGAIPAQSLSRQVCLEREHVPTILPDATSSAQLDENRNARQEIRVNVELLAPLVPKVVGLMQSFAPVG